jgi:hypothetical protein
MACEPDTGRFLWPVVIAWAPIASWNVRSAKSTSFAVGSAATRWLALGVFGATKRLVSAGGRQSSLSAELER